MVKKKKKKLHAVGMYACVHIRLLLFSVKSF